MFNRDTMKIVIVSIVLFSNVVFAQLYTSKYDNTDVDAILHNDRLVKQYVDCMLDKKPCTKLGEELRAHIEEALETKCAKCTETQRANIRKVVRHLVKNKPDWWKALCDKYDPDGKYQKEFADLLKDAVE